MQLALLEQYKKTLELNELVAKLGDRQDVSVAEHAEVRRLTSTDPPAHPTLPSPPPPPPPPPRPCPCPHVAKPEPEL